MRKNRPDRRECQQIVMRALLQPHRCVVVPDDRSMTANSLHAKLRSQMSEGDIHLALNDLLLNRLVEQTVSLNEMAYEVNAVVAEYDRLLNSISVAEPTS